METIAYFCTGRATLLGSFFWAFSIASYCSHTCALGYPLGLAAARASVYICAVCDRIALFAFCAELLDILVTIFYEAPINVGNAA